MYSFGFCMMTTPGKAKRIRGSMFKLEDGTEVMVPAMVSSNENPELLRREIHKYVDDMLDLTLRDEK